MHIHVHVIWYYEFFFKCQQCTDISVSWMNFCNFFKPNQIFIAFFQITHIVVDEVHCVLSWGQSKFRPAYLRIPSLRAILVGAKVLALTATATVQSQRDILKELLMEGAQVIAQSPDRWDDTYSCSNNVYYSYLLSAIG